MITLNFELTDAEYRRLIKAKAKYGRITWARFILKLARGTSIHKTPRYCLCGMKLKTDAEKRESVCHNCK